MKPLIPRNDRVDDDNVENDNVENIIIEDDSVIDDSIIDDSVIYDTVEDDPILRLVQIRVPDLSGQSTSGQIPAFLNTSKQITKNDKE